MGYLFLTVAIFAGAAKGFFGKKISGTVVTYSQSIFVNLIRMIICVVISLGFLLAESYGKGIVIDAPALIFGSMAGITLSAFTVTWLLAIRHGAYMLVSVAQTFGMVVTIVFSFIVFEEPIGLKQIIGILILMIAVLIMSSYSKGIKGSLSPMAVALLALCGLSSGLMDFSQKLFTSYSNAEVSTLNLLTYIIGTVVLGGLCRIPSKDGNSNYRGIMRKVFQPIIIMSVCLFLNSYFMALSTKHLSAAQIYPLSRAGGMILATLMSAVFFKEKITVRLIVGLASAFAAIMLLK